MASRASTLTSLEGAIHALGQGRLSSGATALLNTLGYESDRTIELSPNTFEGFYSAFGASTEGFSRQNALADEWRSADLLFQLTDEDLSGASSLFDAEGMQLDRFNSLLFMAVELAGSSYTRTDLARVTREVNKCFLMPVVILFRHGQTLSLAVIHRREHKRAAEKDVLEKVTLIKDISTARPHRAHLEILADLALDELALRKKHRIQNFETLFSAWQEALDTSELNKRFYKELSNWYFWALSHAKFPKLPSQESVTGTSPAPRGADRDSERNPVALIRLITRLIFVWFIKEKGLVPEELFDKGRVNLYLADKHKLDGSTSTGSPTRGGDKPPGTYYRAILQNLFFATLNTDMNRDSPGSRGFKGASKEGQGYNDEYMAHSRYRYRSYFKNPEDALRLFESIPFLNGGLFECLDKPAAESASGKEERIDGFSDDPRKQAELPDFLFFGEDDIDLSEVYGTKSKRKEHVRGILRIFERYKFTIDENTPVEEEVALDPELLGKVFENLLASYNPETRTTARKQTGSFYTPREIVNYMVDESLIAILETTLKDKSPPNPPLEKGGTEDVENSTDRLRQLFAYDDAPHTFSEAEVKTLIETIDNLKILDPACGSGAFPMGILKRLVTILAKLDSHNERWKAQQLEREIAPVLTDIQTAQRISYEQAREQAIGQLETRLQEIKRAFEENDHDYARKLFLIENCIYGVDIQPIAVQIAKLRCFISLIVDQRVEDDKPNRGMLALPNLETKFVAANTLIGIDKPKQGMFEDPLLTTRQDELKKLRHEHFQARRWPDKKKLREKDKKLRKEIAELLKRNIFVTQDGTAEKLANWNPYDQNATSTFFDAEWMFGLSGGFSIVIGNPPYVRHEQIKEFKPLFKQQYETFTGTADLYVYFYEKSIQVLEEGGVLTFISSNSFLNAGFAEMLRVYLATKNKLVLLIDFGEVRVFDAITEPCILMLQKTLPQQNRVALLKWDEAERPENIASIFATRCFSMPQSKLTIDGWHLERPDVQDLLEKLRSAGTPLGEYVNGRFYYGIKTGFNEAFVVDRATRDRLIAEHESSAEVLKPFLRGRDVKRWQVDFADFYLIKIESSENKAHPWSRKPDAEAEKIFAKTYPAIYGRFQNYREELIKRYDQGKYFWELRACAYWQEFEQPKIILGRFMNKATFSFDNEAYFHNDALYMISGANEYVVSVLNSSSSWWFLRQICTDLQNGYLQAFRENLFQIPIPVDSSKHQKTFETLVCQILTAKEQDPKADVRGLEKEIDALVYELYGLTDEEIAMVEGR